jgi:hypothetical protein
VPQLINTKWSDDSDERFLRMLICAEAKAGKTSLGATAPYPYFVACEPGIVTLRALHVPYVPAKSVDDLKLVLTALRQDPDTRGEALGVGDYPIQTIVLDVLDEAQRFFVAQRLAETQKPTLQGWEDWAWLADKMRSMVKAYMALPMHVVFLCHLKDREDDNNKVESKPMLDGAIRDEIAQYVDVAGVLTVREDVYMDPQAGPQVRITRILRTQPTSKVQWVGDRLMILPPEYILQRRERPSDRPTDLTDLIAAAFGSSDPAAVREPAQPAMRDAHTPISLAVSEPAPSTSPVPETFAGPPVDERAPEPSPGPTIEGAISSGHAPVQEAPEASTHASTPLAAAAPQEPTPDQKLAVAIEREAQSQTTSVAVMDQSFLFNCELCDAEVSDPNRDQFELSEYRKGKHLCVACFQNAPNI